MTTGTPNVEYVRACKKCDNIFVSPFRRAKICGDCHKVSCKVNVSSKQDFSPNSNSIELKGGDFYDKEGFK